MALFQRNDPLTLPILEFLEFIVPIVRLLFKNIS